MNFGVRLAQQFGLDAALIVPQSVSWQWFQSSPLSTPDIARG